jgi:hypothetical protein
LTKIFAFLSVLYVVLLILFVNSLLKQQNTQLSSMKVVISHNFFNCVHYYLHPVANGPHHKTSSLTFEIICQQASSQDSDIFLEKFLGIFPS